MAKVSISEYVEQINKIVVRTIGLSIHDLEDCPFADWHEANVKPETAAKRAIKRAGGGMFC